MVPQRREDGRLRKVLEQQLVALADDVEVLVPGLVPHVVRRQVTRPDDVVQRLKTAAGAEKVKDTSAYKLCDDMHLVNGGGARYSDSES